LAKTKQPNQEQASGVLAVLPELTGLAPIDVQRARAACTVVLRVEFLERILPLGVWGPRLQLDLSELWGVTPGVVGDYAGESWRRIASYHSPHRSEEIRAEFLARIRFIGEDALKRTKEICNVHGDVVTVRDPDHRTALASVVEMATLTNIRETRWRGKVDLASLSEEDILKQLEQAGYSVAKRASDVPALGEEVEKKE